MSLRCITASTVPAKPKYLLYFLSFGSDGLGSSLLEIVHGRLLALLHGRRHRQLLFTRFRRMGLLLGTKQEGRLSNGHKQGIMAQIPETRLSFWLPISNLAKSRTISSCKFALELLFHDSNSKSVQIRRLNGQTGNSSC